MPENVNLSGIGRLVVQVTTARDSLPVENAIVTVSTVGAGGVPPVLLHTASTDRSGLTPSFDLPAPPRASSMSSGQNLPFAVYTVQIEHEGYQPVGIVNVSIFDGVASTLPVFLVPLPEGQSSSEERTIEVIPPPPLT